MSATCKVILNALFPACQFSKKVLRLFDTTVLEAKKGISFDKVVVHESAPSNLVVRVLKSIDALGKPFSVFWYRLKWDAKYNNMRPLQNVCGVWVVKLHFSNMWEERAATSFFPNASSGFCNMEGRFTAEVHIFCRMFSVCDANSTHHKLGILRTNKWAKEFPDCPFSKNLFDTCVTQRNVSKNVAVPRCTLCKNYDKHFYLMWD